MTDTTIIEEKAVHKLESLVLEDDRLASHIEKGDRAPVFDGYIEVYESGSHTINNLRYRVPVQVKGTESAIKKRGASYTFDRRWLEAYAKDSGAIFFVVFENPKSREMSIYYKTFLPAYAKKILMTFTKKQKRKNFRLINLTQNSLWSILENFYKLQIEMSRQTKIVDVTKVSEMSDLKVNLPIGADLFDIYPEDIAWSGTLDGKPALINFKEGKFEFFQVNNFKAKFPNGEIFDAVVIAKSKFERILSIGNFIKFKFVRNQDGFNVTFKPNFKNPNRMEIFEKLSALESFINKLFIYVYVDGKPKRMDLSFKFDEKVLANIRQQIKFLKQASWLQKILKIDYLDNFSSLDDPSKNTILHLINLHENRDLKHADHLSIFRIKIKNDFFILTYDDTGDLRSVFDKKNMFFVKDNFVLTNNPDDNEYYHGNPYVLINESLHQMPDYDIAMVLNNFENKTVVPEWYADSVNQLGLAYIKSFDISNDIKWLTGAKEIFSLPFLTEDLVTCINIAQIYYRQYSGKLRPAMVRKLINLDDENNMIAHLCVAILTEDAENAKITWKELTKEEKNDFKKFSIISIVSDEFKEIFNS